MAINLNDNIKVLAGKATDARYLNNLTPYTSTTEANTLIGSTLRYRGLTVNINGVEYWYKDGILDGNLVVKDSAISGVGITGATNGLTKSGSNVKLGGTITGNTTLNISNDSEFLIKNELSSFDITKGTKIETNYDFGGGLYVNSFSDVLVGAVELNSSMNAGIGLIESKLTVQGGAIDSTVTCIGGYGNLLVSPNQIVFASGTGATNVKGINITPSSALVMDRVCLKGLEYENNYSANFTARSLVDAAYVTGKTSTSGIQSASNGLTKSGSDVKLGGALSQTTTLSGASNLCITAPFTANNIQNFIFDETPTPDAYQEGRLYYKNNALNLDREFSGVTLQIGEETVVKVTNVTGSPIVDGTAVYITGAIGGLPTIAKAIASNPYQANNTIGLVTQTVADNGETYVTLNGKIHDLNTIGYTVGQPVYLSPTVAGGLTATKPSYPNDVIHIGYVTVVSATVGEILVMIDVETEYTTIGQFTGYTASTKIALGTKLNTSIFNSYTGTTSTCITYLDSVADKALTGATNGLSYANRCVCLGGSLASPTTVSGAHALTLGDLNGITLSTANTNDIGLNAKSNGGVYVKSQSGTVASVSDFTNAVGIAADFNALGGFAIYDCRTGVNQTGIIYADDYSSKYTSRSLVDKGYVDSVATGLNVHGAVAAATTGDIVLSGLSSVDGITITNGMRVLVKNQIDGTKNGIYNASATTWQRSSDYNFNPTGEVSNGDLIPVTSGNTNANSQWILVSPNPIVSGTTSLVFSLFSQQQGITEGNGICVTNVGTNKQIAVKTSTSASGLCFDGTGLELDWTTYRNGLCACPSTGKIDVRACATSATGSEVCVKINTGGTNTLYIDSSDIITCLGTPIVNACNGLTKVGNYVKLGGALTGDTTISGNAGAYDLSFSGLDGFALGFDDTAIITDSNGSPKGLQYAADYSGTYSTRSLTDKAYVDGKVVSGVNAGSGLSKGSNNTIILGGTLTGNTQIIYGANRLCFIDGGTSSMDMLSDCSRIHTENTSLYLQSCTSTSCNGIIGMNNTGAICLTTNNATLPICVTAPHGMKYAADYSANFTARSLVDKGYVTGLTTTSGIQTASNGLTKTGTNVVLGGNLCETTSIYSTGSNDGLLLGTSANPLLCFEVYSDDGFRLCDSGSAGLNLLSTASVNLTTTLSCIDININSMTVDDGNNSKGLEYAGDYSSNFTARSLVDAAYVTGKTSQAILTASNGLTKTGTDVVLGGTLTGDTNIAINGELNFDGGSNTTFVIGGGASITEFSLSTDIVSIYSNSGGTINLYNNTTLDYGADYSANFTARSLVDAAYVTGKTSTSGIQTASNGLTKSGTNVKLGGALTENTNVTGAFNLGANVNNINLTGNTVNLGGTVKLTSTPSAGATTDSVLVWNSTDKTVKSVGGTSLGDRNNIYSYTTVTTSVTLTTGSSYVILANSPTSGITLTLPATPLNGQAFKLKDIGGNALVYGVTVAGNGKNIDGASTALINTSYGALEIMYNGTNWFSMAFIN